MSETNPSPRSQKHRAKGWISLGVVFLVAGLASVETYRLRKVDASTTLPMATLVSTAISRRVSYR